MKKQEQYGVLVLHSRMQKWQAIRSWLSIEEALFAAQEAFKEGLRSNVYTQVRISKMEK